MPGIGARSSHPFVPVNRDPSSPSSPPPAPLCVCAMQSASPASSSDGGQTSGDEEDESSQESGQVHGPVGEEESCSASSPTRSQSPTDQPIVDDSDLPPHDLQQLQQDKDAIYKHPLLPLVALLLEKCEYATATLRMQTSDSSATSSSSSPSAGKASSSSVPFDAFNAEVQSFVQKQQSEGKPLLSDDPDLDNLMIKAIQVLRIHLLELEKVQDLCKDFCQRYITCLRTKMSSENLLRGTSGIGASGGGGSFDDSSRSSSPSSSGENSPAPPFHRPTHAQTVYQMVQRNQGLVPEPLRLSPGSSADSSHPVVSQRMPILDTNRDSGNEGDLSDDASNANGCSAGGSSSGKKSSQKRGILPKHATSVMRSWLFQHIVHPYPTEDEKRAIATQTNLTLLQVNNWFINARRRILQPMLDSANSLNSENNSNNNMSRSSPPSAKKLKGTSTGNNNKTAGRFWSDSLTSDQGGGVSARSSAD